MKRFEFLNLVKRKIENGGLDEVKLTIRIEFLGIDISQANPTQIRLP